MNKNIEKNIGKTFGGLKVLGRTKRNEKRIFIDCVCIHCGSIVPAEMWNVFGNHYKSCGCLKHAHNTKSPRWKGCGEISLTKFNSIKSSAIRRKIDFNITIEEMWDLFLKQERLCSLSGLHLRFPASRVDYKSTASLDRINSNIGYETGNIQWVHKDVNIAKQSMDNKSFLNLIKIIYEYNKK